MEGVTYLFAGCGALPQFNTPEYAKLSSIQTPKWESSESVDPYSYGYNRYTCDEHYCSPKYLITTLIDIVSKNGNYLLNIGPDGDGIVPPPVVQRLKAIGEWLGHSGDCIFDTMSELLMNTVHTESLCHGTGLFLPRRRVQVTPLYTDMHDILHHRH